MSLKIQKKEIRIFARNGFHVPIHPRLLEESLEFDPQLAINLFPRAAKEWYDDLRDYAQRKDLSAEEKEDCALLLSKGKPRIFRYGDAKTQRLTTVPSWSDEVHTDERGFARVLSIGRVEGTLGFDRSRMIECTAYMPLSGKEGRRFHMARSKASQLAFEVVDDNTGKIYTYAQHNVDRYSGALFLRNWAILYLNEALRSVS